MMETTYRDAPIGVGELEALLAEFGPQFSEPQRVRESWDGLRRWCVEKHLPVTVLGARRWFERDLERDQVLSFRFPTASDPLAEAHPSTFEASDATIVAAIERGDLHNFADPLLPAEQHAVVCLRCKLGVQSRQIADDRARALDKKPFPSFGDVLERLYEISRQRCDDCGAFDDELATDACERSFWHLPDIWLALHPNSALPDMGSLGPFVRGFLRRQRPSQRGDLDES